MKSPIISLASSIITATSKTLLRDYNEIDGLRQSPGSLRMFLQKAKERTEAFLTEGFKEQFHNHHVSFFSIEKNTPTANNMHPHSDSFRSKELLMRKNPNPSIIKTRDIDHINSLDQHCSSLESQNVSGKKQTPPCWFLECSGWDNFLTGFPFFSLSAILKENNKVTCAMTYDPMRHELFWVQRGFGVFLNNRRIRMPAFTSWKKPLLSSPCIKNLPSLLRIFPLRITGAFLLDIAYVASGRLEGGFLPKTHVLFDFYRDFLLLFMQESGGFVETMKNTDDQIFGSRELLSYALSL